MQVTFISKTLSQMPSSLVLKLRHTYAGSHPKRGLKKDPLAGKNGHVLLKIYFSSLIFKMNVTGTQIS